MTALLLLPLAACAGSYSGPVYSGGIATVPSFTHQPPAPYAQGTSTVNGSSYSGYGGDASAATGEAASCSGKITATFTWQPAPGQTMTSDPPPASVIVQETSMASASGTCTPAAPVVGSCDNGIGASQPSLTQTPVVSPGPPPVTIGTKGSGFCYSVHYYVLPGQQVLPLNPSVNSSPNATVSASPTDVTPGASLRYNVGVSPVTINPGGVTNLLTAPTALTGQQLSGTLNVSAKSYAWSVTASGGSADVFKTYNEKAPSNQLVLLTSADTTAAGFNFYDKKQETITIQCNATVLAPDGTPLAVTAKSVPISVVKPTATWSAQQYGVSDEPTDKGFQANEAWAANITVPLPFTGGTGCFAQLVTQDRQLTRSPENGSQFAVYYYKQQYTDGAGKTTWIIPGQGLDASLPYPIGFLNGKPVSPSGGYTWDVSQSGTSGDTPFQYYTTADLDGGGTTWYKTYAHDSFVTWVMYRPPAYVSQGTTYGTVWVPVLSLNWGWTGTAQPDVLTGVWSTVGSVTPNAQGAPTDSPPQWSIVVGGGKDHY